MTIPLSDVDISEWLAFVTLIRLVIQAVSHFRPARGLFGYKSRLQVLAVTTGIIAFGIIALQILRQLTG